MHRSAPSICLHPNLPHLVFVGVRTEDRGILNATLPARRSAQRDIASAQDRVPADVNVGVDHDDAGPASAASIAAGRPVGTRTDYNNVRFLVPLDSLYSSFRFGWPHARQGYSTDACGCRFDKVSPREISLLISDRNQICDKTIFPLAAFCIYFCGRRKLTETPVETERARRLYPARCSRLTVRSSVSGPTELRGLHLSRAADWNYTYRA